MVVVETAKSKREVTATNTALLVDGMGTWQQIATGRTMVVWEMAISYSRGQVADVNTAFTDLNSNASHLLVNVIQVTKEAELCPLKTAKRSMTIPKGEAMKIPCRVNTGPAERRIPILFAPGATAPWPLGLEVAESLLTVDRGKSSSMNIGGVNTSSHDISIKGRTTRRCLHLV